MLGQRSESGFGVSELLGVGRDLQLDKMTDAFNVVERHLDRKALPFEPGRAAPLADLGHGAKAERVEQAGELGKAVVARGQQKFNLATRLRLLIELWSFVSDEVGFARFLIAHTPN